ncbi:uncharacterized protein Triagg1_10638 [Trichoderma aggressivum f. europaeum]|uniref:Uncharacterized protein n=1 Tax=Trichoderma aggressivum f. europaeum TaxID=173218 RepID=A0AAE1I6U9_9HYPO|nr:hypothetical protein Triagg1_10638 [Trichoderma aggressivum f. europaeum]
MAYPEFSDPATLLRDAISFDGVPDDLVPFGFVESRIRQLNTISSNDNLTAQPYTANTRDAADPCSPVCPRTRVEVSASPPVGHSYPGLRINDNHNDDNGVAWEVASTSAHMFNVKPSLRASRSSNSLRLQSPTRDPSRYRSLYRSNQTANEVNDAKLGSKLSRRSHPNLQASSSSIRTRQRAPESSRKEQQDVLEMFDTYGVSRPEGWLSDEKDRQRASGMKTVHCKTELVSGLSTILPGGQEHRQDQQKLSQGTWNQGITHSRSLANLSEPVLGAEKNNRLSHSKSRDSITGYPRESQLRHAEAERQARQQFRHERRHRLEKSYSEMAIPEQCSDCPTCHVNSDPTRHSICCIARQSPSRRHVIDQTNKSTEEELEREILPEDTIRGKAGATSQESRIQHMWPDNDKQTSPRRRIDDLGNKTATQTLKGLLSLHTLDQDTFWTCSEDPAMSQSVTLPHTLHGNQDTPKSILEGASHESIDSVELKKYQASPSDKAIWKTPTIRISPSGADNDVPELQQDVRYDDQMGNAGGQQRQELSHRGMGSPVRKANAWTPKASEKGLGSQDSLRKATSPSKSPQRNIESSDPSTWKQQLRKINDTPTLMSNSPSKGYTLSASDSQRYLGQSATAVNPDEGTLPSSSVPHRSIDEEPTATGYKGLEFTSRFSKRNQAGDVMKESAIPPVTPNSESEISLSRHVCEWRSRYLGLSDAFDKLKIELDIALEHQASQVIAGGELGGVSHQHQYDDYGIEGLTIIVHRRSKEDLVLNTDLREEEAAHVEEE